MSIQFYDKWLSLAGAAVCVSIMVFIDKKMSLLVFCAICVLYKIASRKHEGI